MITRSVVTWRRSKLALIALVAIYGTLAPVGNSTTMAADAPASTAASVTPPSLKPVGAMAAFVLKANAEAVPEVSFIDGQGQPRTLKDFRGKVVLLNLWATWCAPCRKEMPDLDKLQAELGSPSFEVVALSVDRSGPEGARKFLDSIGTKQLALYADPTARMASTLKAIGMPTTLLIDRDGRELGRLTGPADWHSEDAKALMRAAIGAK
jgi:thiol-disulfide isomerase/thioredoxin